MAKGDIQVYSTGGRISVPIKTWQVGPGTAAINAGEFIVLGTIGTTQYVTLILDAMPLMSPAATNVGTTHVIVGLASANGTHTSTATGTVDAYLPLPGLIYRGKAKTVANANTQGLLDALSFKRVFIDVTTLTHTVDTAATDSVLNGFMIVGGDPVGSFIDFVISVRATIFGF